MYGDKEKNLLYIDKPAGITSYDVIRKLRKEIPSKRMGHSGTLDPFATGLLVIGVDKGTKELPKLLEGDKVYQAKLCIGRQTDTGDIDGAVIAEKPWKYDERAFLEACEGLYGDHVYDTPLYSAVKVKGKPLYWYARNGVTPPLVPKRVMTVYEISVGDAVEQNKCVYIDIIFRVGSGTYIRMLAEELGRAVGSVGMLTALRRTYACGIDVKQAGSIEQVVSWWHAEQKR